MDVSRDVSADRLVTGRHGVRASDNDRLIINAIIIVTENR